jgi:glucose/arabinose dehydrogenase
MKRALFGSIGVLLAAGVLVAQQSGSQPQPRANALPAPGAATAKPSRPVARPNGAVPMAPAGFTVTSYAELTAPRMMVYSPNGDLFVSSPTANNITVLRDANNDGTFEARSVFAQGAPPAARGGGGGGARGVPPAVLGASAPACVPPPSFNTPGPGTIQAPFGLAFNNGYLYVGNTGSIVRFRYTNGDMQAQGQPEKLLDMPVGGHSTRNIIFNRAGTKMYVAVGSQSNNDAGEDCRRG